MGDVTCSKCDNKQTLTYNQEEKIALDWIKVNPHTALVEVIKAHDALSCKCVFDDITPTIKRCYNREFAEHFADMIEAKRDEHE